MKRSPDATKDRDLRSSWHSPKSAVRVEVSSTAITTKKARHHEYDERQFVRIDLHRRRSVIVRMTETGEHLETVRIDSDQVALGVEIAKAGESPEVVLEAIYGCFGHRCAG